jgi:hypothetical protein
LSLSLSGTHPLLSEVEPWHAFKVKRSHEHEVGEARSLTSLLELVKSSPPEAVAFHLARGNDFARWISDILGDLELSRKIEKINNQDPEKARLLLSDALSQRIRELSC